MSTALLAVQTLNGLQLGVLLFLIAAGLTLVFGVMDFINLAHGVQYMLGAYFAVTAYGLTGSFLLALALALAAALVFGLILEIVVFRRLYVAAIQTDDPRKWHPRAFQKRALARLVREKVAVHPNNRVIEQHAHCALDYACPTASNLFFGRWEMAIAVSPGCNARCIGCISKQEEEDLVSPQDRLTFIPTVEEIVEVAVPHLQQAEEAIVSFGQGCEGEPLLQYRRIELAIKTIRTRTGMGVININTNASNPRWLQRLYDAGLDTLRASTISGHPDTYTAYYRPLGYTFEDVKDSLKRARDAGVYSSINLLSFPGMIDREREVEALLSFARETGLRLIQLRNLNIDPEVLLPRMPSLDSMGKALGIRAMIDVLKRELPEVEIGNFSRPVKRAYQVARLSNKI